VTLGGVIPGWSVPRVAGAAVGVLLLPSSGSPEGGTMGAMMWLRQAIATTLGFSVRLAGQVNGGSLSGCSSCFKSVPSTGRYIIPIVSPASLLLVLLLVRADSTRGS